MRGDMGSLYDAHADRLYAYCWSLVGDQVAAAAVGDAFTAAVHRPPRGDGVLWLYSLARSACAERGAFTGGLDGRGGLLFAGSDPLLRAAGALRPDHREVLLLWAGEWLEPHDIARVLGIAPDTVAQLLDAARTRLERSVLDVLMRGTAAGARDDLIAAFEKKRLPRLLAGRAPARAPGWLRDRVLAACEEEALQPLPSVLAPSPLVVIGADRPRPGRGGRPRRGLSGGLQKGLGAAAGVAASAAAVIGLLATWPAAKGGAGAASVAPTATGGQTNPASTTTTGDPRHPLPALTGTEEATAEDPADPRAPAATSGGGPARTGGAPGGAAAPAPSATSPSGTASRQAGASSPGASSPGAPSPSPGTPSRPADPTTPPPGSASPTTPPQTPGDPTTPPDDGSGDPTTPPDDTPTDPPADGPGTPGPSPTTNPTPSPSGN